MEFMEGKVFHDETEDIVAFSARDNYHLKDDFGMKKGLIQRMRPCEAIFPEYTILPHIDTPLDKSDTRPKMMFRIRQLKIENVPKNIQ